MRELDDQFVSVIAQAPKFESLQRAASYRITLEAMFDSLHKGTQSLASRSESRGAVNLYAQCAEAVQAAYLWCLRGEEAQGRTLLMQAHNKLRAAVNRRALWKV
jgi:hypothetical protein